MVGRIVSEILAVAGTPGEAFLRNVRRIDTKAIADVLERKDAIGWHPAVYFNQPEHELHGKRLGCIVGVMTDPLTAQPTGGISRTYVHAGRKVSKAKTLGTPAGVVRLSRDEDMHEGLHLAEGLETSLFAMSLGLRPMWSTGSTTLMASLPVMVSVECLTIFADHDQNGAGEKAAREAEARWLSAGKEVRVLRLREPGDINDAAMRAAA
jgi:hypothetical protein